MAQVVQEVFPPPKPRGEPFSAYNIGQWADGQKWRLEKGVDYQVKSTTFRSYLYEWAEWAGLDVESHVEASQEAVRFQFFEPSEENEE